MNLGNYDADDQLSTNECAALARVNRRTVVTWIRSGQLEASRLPGRRGHYRIRYADFKRLVTKPATE
jgi:excisionase family DNA binding protein